MTSPKPVATPSRLPRGPVMLDIAGHELTDEDRAVLMHPLVGGVILFTRNFVSKDQLQALTTETHKLREPALLIGVDHEGGRVQRFREGFSLIPPMRHLGALWDQNPGSGEVLQEAMRQGELMASELRAVGVDFTFAPVLDLDYGQSSVIGDRAFHSDPIVVSTLAQALAAGMRAAGMSAVGKHFPGHGFAAADSHLAAAIDDRSYSEILAADIRPFADLIESGHLTGVMPAHVIYPQVDSQPAGYSEIWLKQILREALHFDGVIFSDDLSMVAAHSVGDVVARAEAATRAGCDVVLLCNDRPAALELLARWQPDINPHLAGRMAAMAGQ